MDSDDSLSRNFNSINISPEKKTPEKSKSLTLSSPTLEKEKDNNTSEDEESATFTVSTALPPLPKSIIGSKIARATFFVKNNKVSHNVLLKVHHVVDERDVIHNVLLFSKPVCTCVKKKLLSHIGSRVHFG